MLNYYRSFYLHFILIPIKQIPEPHVNHCMSNVFVAYNIFKFRRVLFCYLINHHRFSGIKRTRNKENREETSYSKLLALVKEGKLFEFTPGRKPFPDLKTSKNIYFDSKSKKTLVTWLSESKSLGKLVCIFIGIFLFL